MNKRLIISGCTGVGKSTVNKKLAKLGLNIAIGDTTRQRRSNEVNNVDYNFIKPEKWDNNNYIEVNTYNGDKYGYNKSNLTLPNCVFTVTVQSLLTYPIESVLKVLLVCNYRQTLKRLQSRPERLSVAKREREYVNENLIANSEITVIDTSYYTPAQTAQFICKEFNSRL